jgi:hypothetical protein
VLSGSPCSPLLRHQVRPREIFLHAFDLLELDWHGPAARTHRAAQGHAGEITGGGPGRVCEHLEHGGEIVFRHDGKLGCQGIVSKRLGSRTFPAARGTVSNSRIRPRRLCGSKQKMIGSDGRQNAGRAELAANRAARFVVSLRRRAESEGGDRSACVRGACEGPGFELDVTASGFIAPDTECKALQVTRFNVYPWGRRGPANPWGPGYHIKFRCIGEEGPLIIEHDWQIEKGALLTLLRGARR